MSENQLPCQKQEGETGEDDSGGLKTGEEATRRSEQGQRVSIEEEGAQELCMVESSDGGI